MGPCLWSPKVADGNKILFVDFRHSQIERLVKLRDLLSFHAVFDIFIRDFVLPHLESSFPELRKRDFDVLLKKLQSTFEYFEIDPGDISRIQQLASFTNMSPEHIAAVFGARRSGIPRPTSIRQGDVVSVTQQVNEAMQQTADMSVESIRRELEIRFLETEVSAKLLDAKEVQAEIRLARYYLALTSDAHILYRRVFMERSPSTDFSWGGHRAGYLFYSHGESVVYYDIQFEHLLRVDGQERAGIRTLEHSPLVLKNMVFLPIPQSFERYLIPTDRTLRFTVQHQIMGGGPRYCRRRLKRQLRRSSTTGGRRPHRVHWPCLMRTLRRFRLAARVLRRLDSTRRPPYKRPDRGRHSLQTAPRPAA